MNGNGIQAQVYLCQIQNWTFYFFFLNDVCQIVNLPKLYVMVKWLPNTSVNVYILNFYEKNLSHFDVQMHSQTNIPQYTTTIT